MKTGVSLKDFVSYCLWKPFFDSNSPQTSSNLISLAFFVTLRPFTLFKPKIRAPPPLPPKKKPKALLILAENSLKSRN